MRKTGLRSEEELFRIVFNVGLDVHRALGPGLLESAYEKCISFELLDRGLMVERQKALPLLYKGRTIDAGFRIDLLVERKFIVELKTVEYLDDLHLAQILTYLRLAPCRLGMLINFNTKLFKNGVRRVINTQSSRP